MTETSSKPTIGDTPTLLQEWDWELNPGKDPHTLTIGSGYKAMWKCLKGHSWQAPVLARGNGGGCPYCSGRRPIVGETDLATTHPELASEWHPTRNSLTPQEVSSGSSRKVWWQCSKGHEWEAVVNNRTGGRGCAACSGRKVVAGLNDLASVNPELVVEWHPDNAKSPQEVTAGSGYKAKWVCSRGHEWEASVYTRSKHGCPQCVDRKFTPQEFIQKAKESQSRDWDYSNTHYTGMLEDVRIGCPQHGEFQQLARAVLAGVVGCPECNTYKMTTSRFVSLATEKFGDKYDYSQTLVEGTEIPTTVICQDHGPFKQSPYNHLKGHEGCGRCNGREVLEEDLVRRVEPVWGDRFDYSLSKYTSARDPITIICKVHGEFQHVLGEHLRGKNGCRPCVLSSTSKGEIEVNEFVQSLGLSTETNRKDLLGSPSLELDIYVPELGVAIEFNGIYYHSEKFKDKSYHLDKYRRAKEQDIRLVQVWEDDWMYRRPIVEEHLLRVLGKSNQAKVPARKTVVKEVPYSVAKEFYLMNHIQGEASASVHLGAFYQEELVAIASFLRKGEDYELVRYASSKMVQGGHSKIVTEFERRYTYEKLVTFADLTFSDGGLYKSTGWVQDKVLNPDYRYLVGNERVHKFNYRLKRFREDPSLEYREGMTETELAKLNGLLRVYDAGKVRFIKPHPQL